MADDVDPTEDEEEHVIGDSLTGEALRHFEESYEENREAMEELADL